MKIAIAIIFALVCHMAMGDAQVGKVCTSTSFYWNGTACTACPAGCSECVWKNNAVSCINCGTDTGKYLSIVGDLGVCANCTGNCSACKGPAIADCYNPAAGYSIAPSGLFKCSATGCLYCTADNTCGKCQFGYQLSNATCVPCNSQYCADCSDSNSVCKKCTYKTQLNNGTCTPCDLACTSCPCTACNSGFRFFNASCSLCTDLNCGTCDANNSVCTACKNGFYLNATCQKCADGCTTCTSGTQCSACSTGYTLNDGKCTLCPNNCDKCDGTGACTACSSNYYPSTDKKTCTQCPSGCVGCDSTGVCTACAAGTFARSDKKGCDTCGSYGCSVCANATTCGTCSSNYNPDGKGGCKSFMSCSRGQQLDGLSNCTNGSIDNCAYGNNLTASCYQCAGAYYANAQACSPCLNGCGSCYTSSGSMRCLTVAQPGFSVLWANNGGNDLTGYLGTGLVATVTKDNKVKTCMPNALLASPILNPTNLQCVSYDACTYPSKIGTSWSCFIEGKNAVKVTVSIFAAVVAAIFTL